MKNKLVVCIMGQDCEKFIGMCLGSVKDADAIVYCDGGSKDKTIRIVDNFLHSTNNDINAIIKNDYNQEDLAMNGKQRNYYLNFLKKEFPDCWCLALDADEVVEDLQKVKDFIQQANEGLYSVKMRHFIGDLGNEDATQPVHFVPNRLFKISEATKYPEVEHTVLQGNVIGHIDITTIWHLAYIPNLFEYKKKYENHMKKSEMHTKEYLKQWYYSHIFGQYPKTPINITEIPKVILNEFGIDWDELYFANRGLEFKHFIDAIHWKEYFGKGETIDFFEFGCGRGPRLYALEQIGCVVNGEELSEYAVENSLSNYIEQGDLLKSEHIEIAETIIAYDLLEHIDYKDIDKAIDNLIKAAQRYILISVPVKGDPNLLADPTHKIKETKTWWIEKFTDRGLKLNITPNHFLYKEQVMIFEKKK